MITGNIECYLQHLLGDSLGQGKNNIWLPLPLSYLSVEPETATLSHQPWASSWHHSECLWEYSWGWNELSTAFWRWKVTPPPADHSLIIHLKTGIWFLIRSREAEALKEVFFLFVFFLPLGWGVIYTRITWHVTWWHVSVLAENYLDFSLF